LPASFAGLGRLEADLCGFFDHRELALGLRRATRRVGLRRAEPSRPSKEIPMTTLRSTLFALACFAPFTVALGGCTAQADLEAESTEETASTEDALVSGWTSYISEETPPLSCDQSSLISSVQISGSYADNIRAFCQPTRAARADSYWTPRFSEEGTNYQFCNAGYWATGLSCSGRYCDNVSIQCSRMTNVTPQNCYWSGWVSEEGSGRLNFGSGYYARGAQCSGRYCDNMRFYVCQL